MAREQFQTLTEPMYYILIALSEECCGVDIMEKVQKISGGRVKVGPGTLYTMLSKFEENQIIFRTKEEGRRKSYVITEHGRKLLQEEHERLCIMLADWNGYFDKNLLYYNNRQAAGEPPEKSKDRIERFFCGNRERTRNRSCSGSRTFGNETG